MAVVILGLLVLVALIIRWGDFQVFERNPYRKGNRERKLNIGGRKMGRNATLYFRIIVTMAILSGGSSFAQEPDLEILEPFVAYHNGEDYVRIDLESEIPWDLLEAHDLWYIGCDYRDTGVDSPTGNITACLFASWEMHGSIYRLFQNINVPQQNELNTIFFEISRDHEYYFSSGPKICTVYLDVLNQVQEPNEANNYSTFFPRIEEPQPVISISVNNIDFGEVTIGEPEVRSITIQNEGNAPLILSDFDFAHENGFSLVEEIDSFEMFPNDSCSIAVEFAPEEFCFVGFQNELSMITNDPDNEEMIIILSGIGMHRSDFIIMDPFIAYHDGEDYVKIDIQVWSRVVRNGPVISYLEYQFAEVPFNLFIEHENYAIGCNYRNIGIHNGSILIDGTINGVNQGFLHFCPMDQISSVYFDWNYDFDLDRPEPFLGIGRIWLMASMYEDSRSNNYTQFYFNIGAPEPDLVFHNGGIYHSDGDSYEEINTNNAINPEDINNLFFGWTFSNTGHINAKNHQIRLRIEDVTDDQNKYEVHNVLLDPISTEAGEENLFTSYEIPEEILFRGGNYRLTVELDATQQVDEYDEENNSISFEYAISGNPEIVATPLDNSEQELPYDENLQRYLIDLVEILIGETRDVTFNLSNTGSLRAINPSATYEERRVRISDLSFDTNSILPDSITMVEISEFSPRRAGEVFADLQFEFDNHESILVRVQATGVAEPNIVIQNQDRQQVPLDEQGRWIIDLDTLEIGQLLDCTFFIENDGSADVTGATTTVGQPVNFQYQSFEGITDRDINANRDRRIQIIGLELMEVGEASLPITVSFDDYEDVEVIVTGYYPGVPEISLFGDMYNAEDQTITFEELPVREVGATLLVISNRGTGDLIISDVVSDNECFSTGFVEEFVISPGQESELSLFFEPQRVGEFEGSLIITSNDPEISEIIISLSGSSFELEYEFYFYTPPIPRTLTIMDNLGFVVGPNNCGLRILNVTDPENVTEISNLNGFAYNQQEIGLHDIDITGGNAFITSLDGEILVLNISDPENPESIERWIQLNREEDLYTLNESCIAGNYMYVATSDYEGVMVFSIADPANIDLVTYYRAAGAGANCIHIDGTNLYTGCYSANENMSPEVFWLTVCDASEPENLRNSEISRIELDFNPNKIIKQNDFILCIGERQIERNVFEGGFEVIDVSDPNNPEKISSYSTNNRVYDAEVVGNHLCLRKLSRSRETTIQLIDISDINNPSYVDELINLEGSGKDLEIKDGYVFLPSHQDGQSGMHVIDLAVCFDLPGSSVALNTLEIAFGEVPAGYILDEFITITNTGDADLDISGITISEPEVFSIGVDRITLSSGESQELVVSFEPHWAGEFVGLMVFETNDPDNPEVTVNLTGNSPGDVEEAGKIVIDGSSKKVDFRDNLLFVASPGGSLHIIDVTDLENPQEIGVHHTPGQTADVTVDNNLAYIADYDFGLRILDVTDPEQISEIGYFDTEGISYGIELSGNLVYLSDGESGICIINVEDPQNPVFISSYDTPGVAHSVEVVDNLVFVADSEGGMRIIDLSDPENPEETGFYDTPGQVLDIVVNDQVAYLAEGEQGLRTIDVSDPTNPTEVGNLNTPGSANGVTLWGDNVFVANGLCGMRVINVSDPSEPEEVTAWDTRGNTNSVLIHGNEAYLADGSIGLVILDVSVLRPPVLLPTSLFAENCIHINPGSVIESGDVWVNLESQDRFFDNEFELHASPRVNFAESVSVVANRVRLLPNSTIEGNLTCNEFRGNGDVTGETNSPIEQLPLLSQECSPEFPEFDAGDEDIDVRSQNGLELQAGVYGDLIVRSRRTIHLAGGSYIFNSIELRNQSRFVYQSSAEVRVKNKFSTGNDVVICPDPETDLSARDLIIYVEGINGRNGRISDNPKAVFIGSENDCRANIYAPNGTVRVENRTEFEGSILGREIWLGSNVEICYNGAFFLQDFDGEIVDGKGDVPLSDQDLIPDEFTIDAYPNPFNSTLTLSYGIPENGLVQAKIFDLQGRLIGDLLNRHERAGYHRITWSADQHPTGIYILNVKTSYGSLYRKINLIK